MDSTIKEILAVIGSITAAGDIGCDESLGNYGISSLNLLTLISQIEDVFDIEIPDGELVFENFDTVNKINNLVDRVKNPSP